MNQETSMNQFDFQALALYSSERKWADLSETLSLGIDAELAANFTAELACMYGIACPRVMQWYDMLNELPFPALSQLAAGPVPLAMYSLDLHAISVCPKVLAIAGFDAPPLWVMTHEISHAVTITILRELSCPQDDIRQIPRWRSPHGPAFVGTYIWILTRVSGLPQSAFLDTASGIYTLPPDLCAPDRIRETFAQARMCEYEVNGR